MFGNSFPNIQKGGHFTNTFGQTNIHMADHLNYDMGTSTQHFCFLPYTADTSGEARAQGMRLQGEPLCNNPEELI